MLLYIQDIDVKISRFICDNVFMLKSCVFKVLKANVLLNKLLVFVYVFLGNKSNLFNCNLYPFNLLFF